MDIGIGEIIGHIPPPINLRGRPLQIHDDVASPHLHRRPDHDVLFAFHLFDDALCSVEAVGDPIDRPPQAPLGAAHDFIRQIVQPLQMIILQHLANLLGAHMIGGDLGANVPDHFIRSPDIPANHIHHRFIEHAPIIELDRGDEKALFKHLMVVGGDATPDI